ncbi:hypothetical protein T265_07247 [Opisthorchis viverrini]|uniref:Uncharacterized protein n=1 Tax=Opisthorchis viverrini TaxID=6198 RepID=A0A074ZD93_OPIVI|nr:hypothetical protein T265_07247 [Opisthorchis viverrini]KER25261.1 hypothetical protein T265_07247 [Opisthorchis viverrini]
MGTEVETNPFRPGGELSLEADSILKNSTILRDTVIINDPSLRRAANGSALGNETPQHPIKTSSHGDSLHAFPPRHTSNGPTPTDPSSLNEPITCEVVVGHVSSVPAPGSGEQQKIEHVIINDPSLRRAANGSALGNETPQHPIKTSSHGDSLHAFPPRHTSNGPTPTDPSSLNEPITCEVVVGHVSSVPAPGSGEQQKIEHVRIQNTAKPTKCCVLQLPPVADFEELYLFSDSVGVSVAAMGLLGRTDEAVAFVSGP